MKSGKYLLIVAVIGLAGCKKGTAFSDAVGVPDDTTQVFVECCDVTTTNVPADSIAEEVK